jgi:formiminotetrahydrofolate cyclodeaminase
VTCAVAAALVEMAAGFSEAAGFSGVAGVAGVAGVPEAAGVRAAALRNRALELADLDLESYGPVLDALTMDADDPRRPRAVAQALSGAAEVPFALAGIGAEVAALAAQVAELVGRHVVGDAAVAAVLAEAVCQAAAALVALNLAGATDERPTRAAQRSADAAVARRKALVTAHKRPKRSLNEGAHKLDAED